jgi:dTDP-4-amino-4,6-dideoxygalactose transaminase
VKACASHLAIFGGLPLYLKPLHVGQPVIENRDLLLSDFDSVMRSGQLTNNGPRLKEFEAAVCRITRTRHCVATCNATVALQIAARALRLTGEVIMPAFTFIATAHAMEWIGLTPVFADVDPLTHTLDPASAEACISSRTSAILPVHLWGHVCHTQTLRDICDRHQLRLMFDSSHAFGCQHHETAVGGFGELEVFSFHATKFVHAFEGGAIVTNDDEIAERCRRLRAFGIVGLTEISDVGTNGKMHELSAAAGLRSLMSMPERMTTNAVNRLTCIEQLRTIPGLSVLPVPDGDVTNGQYLVVCVDEDRFGLSRDQLIRILRTEGVFARSYFAPGCHRAEPYVRADAGVHVRVALPVTERLSQTILQLPTGPAVSIQDIRSMGWLMRLIHRSADQIQHSWSNHDGRLFCHADDPARPHDAVIRKTVPVESVLREAG